MSLTTQKHIEP